MCFKTRAYENATSRRSAWTSPCDASYAAMTSRDAPARLLSKPISIVLDWRRKAATTAAVRTAIRDLLDEVLADPYPPALFDVKVLAVFDHVLTAYGDRARRDHGRVRPEGAEQRLISTSRQEPAGPNRRTNKETTHETGRKAAAMAAPL